MTCSVLRTCKKHNVHSSVHEAEVPHAVLHAGIGLPKVRPAAYNCGCVRKGNRGKTLLHTAGMTLKTTSCCLVCTH